MDALIYFKIKRDGELVILIHRDLWQEIKEGPGNPDDENDQFMRVQLVETSSERVRAFFASPPTDNDPCRPVVRFDVT